MQQLIAIALTLLIAFSEAAPKEIHSTDANWNAVLTGLQAGDVLTVHAGTYVLTGYFAVTWLGTEANPIVVQGAAGEARPVFQQTSIQNIANMNGEYFVVKGIEFTGGSRGLRLGSAQGKFYIILL